ncbi:MAG: hypothetical protein A4S14_08425 [Proteobacteria bacterium SG_bin9]|nr:MAG: hypothetical protein A4S14_08425 [Proteobacteria bacterium SG_bin9]
MIWQYVVSHPAILCPRCVAVQIADALSAAIQHFSPSGGQQPKQVALPVKSRGGITHKLQT